MAEKQEPRFPDIGEWVRSQGRLVEIQDVTPPVVTVTDYIFEIIEASVVCRLNGKLVKGFSTFNEFYGEGSAVEAAIAEAKIQAVWHGPSNMEFVVIKKTMRRRKRPVGRKNFYDETFIGMEAIDRGSHWDLPEDSEEDVFTTTYAAEKPAAV